MLNLLYTLHEMSHAAVGTLADVGQHERQHVQPPVQPAVLLPAQPQDRGGSELFVRVTQRYQKPEFGISETRVGGKAVAVSETVAVDKPFCRLLHFERDLGSRQGRSDPTVLLVAPCRVTTPRCCATPCARSSPTTRSTSPTGSTRAPSPVEHGPFTLDDYVGYIREFIRHIGPDRLHVIAVCQPDGAGPGGRRADGGGRRTDSRAA